MAPSDIKLSPRRSFACGPSPGGIQIRVFVTGASGHIGSALVPELLEAGHEVVGLARSDASAEKLLAAGAEVQRGNLSDLEDLKEAAADSDGVIHLAFNHEAMFAGNPMDAIEGDQRVIGAIGEALEGSNKPFVGTSGTLMLAAAGITGRPGAEDDVLEMPGRVEAENTVIAMADNGVRSSVVRLAPLVHSDLDHHGFGPIMIGFARERGTSAYVGEGANRWPALHTRDAASLYRLALEKAPAGSRLHGVGDEGVPLREIAKTIGRRLDLPTVSVTPDEAGEHFQFLAAFVQLDNPTSNKLTREVLGWDPTHPGLIADLEEEHYFDT